MDVSRFIFDYFDYSNGVYIEAGAYDGVFQSNTIRLEQERGWSGVLVEPSMVAFNKCIKNRSNNNIAINACLVSNLYNQGTISGT